jgi:hypothetical protein
MKRGLCILVGGYLSLVAFVGVSALLEYRLHLKGREWLEYILPFGLATNPMQLSIVTLSALFGAAILFWVAKSS